MNCPYCNKELSGPDSPDQAVPQTSGDACQHCERSLPAGWRSAGVTKVALAGAASAGKTLYIGVLIKELRKMAIELRLAPACEPADETTKTAYGKIYEHTLNVERNLDMMAGAVPWQVPEGTPRAGTADALQKHPLIWDFGEINGQRRYLLLRDVSGEDVVEDDTDKSHLDHIGTADAVLYLVDPLISDQIVTLLPEAAANKHADYERSKAALTRVIQLMDEKSPALGIVLCKFDLIHSLEFGADVTWQAIAGNLGSAFRHDPPTEAGFGKSDSGIIAPDTTDRNLLSLQLHSLLGLMKLDELTNIVQSWRNQSPERRLGMFAVSALGEDPTGGSINPRGMSPYRCLDPIIWALQPTWTPESPTAGQKPRPTGVDNQGDQSKKHRWFRGWGARKELNS